MILVADSGSTKTDWIALNHTGETLFTTRTLGLNPEVLQATILKQRLEGNYTLHKDREKVTHVFFYGAGCGTLPMKQFLKEIFTAYFTKAQISIEEDTYAAIYATTASKEPAIVCILGTGSNCSLYDGEKLYQKVPSLGYILMDDSSGNYFGKQLLRDYFYNNMPEDIRDAFEQSHDVDPDVIKHNLYKQPNPNTYLATFAEFVITHRQSSYCQVLIKKALQQFIDTNILQYEQAKTLPIHFVGSVAYYLKQELAFVLEQNQLKLGKVVQRPIQGLLEYHIKELQQ